MPAGPVCWAVGGVAAFTLPFGVPALNAVLVSLLSYLVLSWLGLARGVGSRTVGAVSRG
ncbi:hypothetical protein EV193_111216 [Herbihabitans rhizosphaerae]|uniref:Uncharacterized protein n=1 Tax=Herbihabitans rhizosphaerae TaxID=1872711 RepID=A0A4Q7KFD6_9PSEU|nr:hypothetical protein EV193_111216 [Herbihabitans rhizosphaerae]